LSQQFGNVLNAVLSAFEKMETVFVARIVYYLGILLAAMTVIYFRLGINTLVLAYLAVGVTSALVSGWLVRKLGVRIVIRNDYGFWKEVLRESAPLFGFIACSHIYGNVDTLLISKFFGNYEVGIYQAAYKILYAFQSINLINAVTSPRITVLLHEGKDQTFAKLNKMFWGLSLLGLIPLVAIISVKSDLIISLIYGEKYVRSAPILTWMIWAGVINYFRIYLTNILIARNKQKWVFYSVLAGLMVNLAMNVFLLPSLGFGFAAISLLVAEVVILLIAGVVVWRK
jgi:O-antigen/teichoic acid export membrane protein